MSKDKRAKHVETMAHQAVQLEQPDNVPLYTEQDLRQWEEGAKRFGIFWQQAEPYLAEKIAYYKTNNLKVIEPAVIALQAILLGERPASFGENGKLEQVPAPIFTAAGLSRSEEYIYRPELVHAVTTKYADDFTGLKFFTPETLMSLLEAASKSELHIPRGLVLGIPHESVITYEAASKLQIHQIINKLFRLVPINSKEDELLTLYFGNVPPSNHQPIIDLFIQLTTQYSEQLKIDAADMPRLVDELRYILNAKVINVPGISWIDYKASAESNRKQSRLRAAFEQSGIRQYYSD